MSKKMFRSSLISALVLLAVSFSIVLWCLYAYFDGRRSESLSRELALAAQGVEAGGENYLAGLAPEGSRFTWVSGDGTVLFDSEADPEDLENHGGREEIREAAETGSGESVRFSATLTQKMVYRASRLSDGSVLRISTAQATPLALVLWMFQGILLLVVLAVVLSAVLSGKMAKELAAPMAQESRREFTANVSHELKTPLQTILGGAELLEQGMVAQEDVPHLAGRIRLEAKRLLALIEDIIRLSQLDERAAMPREAVELLSLCREVAADLAPAAEERAVTLGVTGDSATLSGIRPLLYQLVFNLCDNAVKYNVSGGRVDVSVANLGETVELTVRDTGIGIPQEYHDRVFERFFRVDKSRSKQSGGTGLGLSIVKHAALYHHAAIDLKSAPGKGTAITVTFPLS